MPKPFSRIQLDCTRLFAPPAPANTRPASSVAMATSPVGSVPKLPALSPSVAPVGRLDRRRRSRSTRKTIVRPTLKNSAPLERLVDDGRRGQRHPDREQHDHRDHVRVATDQIGEDRRARRAPAGPDVRHHREDAEQDSPRLPGAGEAGDRGLPRGERVALDLHVEEVLDRDADDGQVQEPDAGVGADVRPQDVLARADPDARQDHARPEHLAQRQAAPACRGTPSAAGGRCAPRARTAARASAIPRSKRLPRGRTSSVDLVCQRPHLPRGASRPPRPCCGRH